MNKAFVRDAEPLAERCPRCGSIGQPVSHATLDAFVRPESRLQVGETANFCPAEACPVAYFDSFERVVPVEHLVRPVYPKDPRAPLCGCFGITCAEIDDDVREGVVARTRAVIERAGSSEAHCTQSAANGRSCVANVQRYFMKRRGA